MAASFRLKHLFLCNSLVFHVLLFPLPCCIASALRAREHKNTRAQYPTCSTLRYHASALNHCLAG